MRATLSTEKKYEIVFAALTHRFVGESPNGLLKFMPENKLGLDGFYGKMLLIEKQDYKNSRTIGLMRAKLEQNLLNADSVNQLTLTRNGPNFVNDYNSQVAEENIKTGKTFEPMLNAFRDQILVMYTLKAEKLLVTAFKDNLAELQQTGLLEDFVNEVASDLFPDTKWTSEDAKAKTADNIVVSETTEEANA